MKFHGFLISECCSYTNTESLSVYKTCDFCCSTGKSQKVRNIQRYRLHIAWQVSLRWGTGCLEGTQGLLWLKAASEPVPQQTPKQPAQVTGFSVLFIPPPNAPLMKLIRWLEKTQEQREEVKTKAKRPIYFPGAKGKLVTDLKEENDQWHRKDRNVCTDVTAHHKVKVYKDDSKCILISITQCHQNLDFAQNVVKEI